METAASAVRFWSQNLAQGSFSPKINVKSGGPSLPLSEVERECPPCPQGQNPHPQL